MGVVALLSKYIGKLGMIDFRENDCATKVTSIDGNSLTVTLPVASSHAGRILQIVNVSLAYSLGFVNGPIYSPADIFPNYQPPNSVAGIFSDGTHWNLMNYVSINTPIP